ncbi:phage tail spike protein [Rossellomorea marisflavi]|uniref:phage tail spike protein n=1 Tax=Rossellomorea marisflavi TaxID=189381 RepID=UPI0034576AFA
MADFYVFDPDDNLLTVLSSDADGACLVYAAPFEDELNREPVFQIKATADHPDASYLVNENQVGFYDKDEVFRLFIIKNPEWSNGKDGPEIIAECVSWMQELEDEPLEDIRAYNVTAETATTRVLSKTRIKVGTVAELGINSANFYYISAKNALEIIINTWGGELKDRVEIDDTGIKDRYIDILPRRGQNAGNRWYIDEDIESLNYRIELSPKTALYGRGSSLQTEDGGFTRKITFADVEWKVSKGDPVDKPLGQEWVGDSRALQKYGRKNKDGTRRHRVGFYEDGEQEDPEVLLQETYNALQEEMEPILNVSMTVHLLESISGYDHRKARLGDTTIAIDDSFAQPIELESRIIKYKYDVANPDKPAEVELGSFLDFNDSDDRISAIEARLNEKSGVWSNPSIPDMGPIDDYDIIDSPPPSIKGLTADGLFKTIKLSWGFNSAIHVAAYELYGSQFPEFIPGPSNLLFRGKTGGYVHNAGTNEQWYFVGRTMNTHGEYSDFSDVVTAQTARIVTDDILFGSVTADLLADLSVSARKLADLAVTSGKLAPGAVTNEKLDDGSVDFSKITNGAVGTVKLADLAVTVGKIVDGAVNNKKLGDLAVSVDKIVDGAINNIKLGNKAVSVEKIVDQAINNAKLGSLSVSYEKLMNNAVIASKLAANAVEQEKIKNGAINNQKLADLAVDAAKLADKAVSATKIANLAVGTAAIQDLAVTNQKVQRLNAEKISVGPGTVFDKNYDPTNLDLSERNLLLNSTFNEGLDKWYFSENGQRTILDPDPDKPQSKIFRLNYTDYTGNSPIYTESRIPIKPGDSFTVSFDMKAETFELLSTALMTIRTTETDDRTDQRYVTVVSTLGSGFNVIKNNFKPGEWVRYTHKFMIPNDLPSNAKYLMFGLYQSAGTVDQKMREIKISKGFISSNEWTPAPEDIEGYNSTLRLWKYPNTSFFDGGKIYTNTVTANQMATGTITAESGIIKDINADIINAGSLNVSSSNLFSFSRPDQSPGYASRINDTEYISKKSLTVDTTSYLRSYTLPVSPGEDIVLSAYFKRVTTGADDFYIRIRFETESAGFAGDVFESLTSYSSEYRKLVAKVKAPTTAARMMIEFRNGASGTVTNVNGIMWHRGIVALDYAPHPDDDINAGAITTDKLYARSVTTSKLATGSVTANEIYARAVTTSKIATGAVTANEIATRTIRSYEMATNTITASSGIIADLAIGNAMIGTLAVTSTKIGIAAVGTLAVADAAITTAKIGNLAVGNAQLDYAAVTSAKIANLAVDNAKIASVDASKINANELSAISANLGKVTAGLVDGVELVSKSPSVGGNVLFNGTTIRAGKAYSQNISTRDSTYNTEEGGELSTGSLRIYRDRITKSTGYALREQGISLYADSMYVTHGEKFEFAGLDNRYFEFKVGAYNSPLSIASGGTSVLKFFANGVSGSETLTMEALRDIEFRSKSSTGSVTFSGMKTNFNVGPYGMNVLSIGSSGNAGDPTVVFQKELANRFAFDGDVDMQNNNLININSLRINDPGKGEGLTFLNGNGFEISESPYNNRVGGNGAGELTVFQGGRNVFSFGEDSRSTFIRSDSIFNRTYTYGSNLYITSNGVMGRDTSSRKFKYLEEEIPKEEAYKILKLKPKTWFDKTTIDQYANYLSNGGSLEDLDIPYMERVPGAIAEDVAELGLDLFVNKGLPDEQGNRSIQGLKYERLPFLFIPILNDNVEDIKVLKHENETKGRRIEELEKKYFDQEERMMVIEEKIKQMGA